MILPAALRGFCCLSVFPIYSTNTSQESKHSVQAKMQFPDKQLQLGLMMKDRCVRADRAVHWDGKTKTGEQVGLGTYFYQLQAGDYTEIRQMVILK